MRRCISRCEAIHEAHPARDVNDDNLRGKGRARGVSTNVGSTGESAVLSKLNKIQTQLGSITGRLDKVESTLRRINSRFVLSLRPLLISVQRPERGIRQLSRHLLLSPMRTVMGDSFQRYLLGLQLHHRVHVTFVVIRHT